MSKLIFSALLLSLLAGCATYSDQPGSVRAPDRVELTEEQIEILKTHAKMLEVSQYFEQCALISIVSATVDKQPVDKTVVKQNCYQFVATKFPWILELSETQAAYLQDLLDAVILSIR